ncbi:hypothetical protein K7472_10730 [Streptomyces sp. PTM05]|uniref:GNAT family N-acetyltransferase n=1 Tax=Streptantibioticus parmotrematis TaxID=2873249 RepID=A0ABS7QQ49_9ACTN|nr:hypothetical protein [Streptantibioticus parmotrematis]MBY8885320.1 hypothetical protein [Streptantibioticus parmotrematis]
MTAAAAPSCRRVEARESWPHSWAARPPRDEDHAALLALFTEPDFHFRTHQPDLLPEWQVLELIAEDRTHVLLDGGEVVGLYAFEEMGGDHAGHDLLHLRLTARLPLTAWTSAFEAIVAGELFHRELVRLELRVGQFDARGLDAARTFGLTEEGTLAHLVVHDGERAGYVFFSRIWEPS